MSPQKYEKCLVCMNDVLVIPRQNVKTLPWYLLSKS